MYFEDNICLPGLHKCKNCKERLVNPVILKYDYEGGRTLFCSKECAKEEHDREQLRLEKIRQLNDDIRGLV